MSPTFETIVRQGPKLTTDTNVVYLGCLLLCVLLAWRLRQAWLSFLVITAISAAAWWIAGTILSRWWDLVTACQVTEADRHWYNDHDGGLLFPIFANVMKAAGCWVAGIIVLACTTALARRKARKSSPALLPPHLL
jgi:hypothetical protein